VSALDRLDQIYRRTGATLPFGDPLPSHGAEMEGYFWRVTDVARRRVIVVLCGVNRHPQGSWATVALAAHPGGFVRSAVLTNACAASDEFVVSAGDGAFTATASEVHLDLGQDARADFSLSRPVVWPHTLGGGGVFSVIPFLGQYWQPHVLGGNAQGTARVADEFWEFDQADVYAEKNWGAGFPERWWWGQAQGFDRPDVCVAFSGGVLTAGRLSATVGGVVVRIGAQVIRLTPPFSVVRSHTDGQRWEVHARNVGYRVHIVGEATGTPHVLPVPMPAEHRNVGTDFEYLAGHLTLEVSGRVHYRGETDLAGLEIGHRPSNADATGEPTDCASTVNSVRTGGVTHERPNRDLEEGPSRGCRDVEGVGQR
jgi:tocopherol cyclase